MSSSSSQHPDIKTLVKPDGKPVPIQSLPRRRLPGWRLWAPLLIQTAIIVAVPAQDVYTSATGTSVTLQTAPVDPYDFLRGYYQTLRYDISQRETLRTLPGGEKFFEDYDYQPQAFFVVLEAPKTETSPPTPWQPILVSETRPDDLDTNQIVLKGQYANNRITYGLERYYMPEDQRVDINAHINETQWRDQEAFVVDIKIDSHGNAVLVGLWVNSTNYRF
ncbi:GDYXXLXY domain-containing protein [Leptothoe sp. ISB3NOV94-8A]